MILHTIIDPYEVMLQNDAALPQFEYIHRGGCILQCVKGADGCQIDRIISTNPQDYLNEQYKIGTIIQK